MDTRNARGGKAQAHPHRHHGGEEIIIAGLLLAVLFAVFTYVVFMQGGMFGPLLIGVGFGIIMAGFGAVYYLKH